MVKKISKEAIHKKKNILLSCAWSQNTFLFTESGLLKKSIRSIALLINNDSKDRYLVNKKN